MVVGEAGFMVANVALTVAATGAFSAEDGGLAVGLLNTAAQVGGGLGLAGVTVVVTISAGSEAGVTPSQLAWGLVSWLLFCAAGIACAARIGGRRASRVKEPAAPV